MKIDKSLCCGCAACINICPSDAIGWGKNGQGFFGPVIREDKCTDCGLCRKVCPYEISHVGKDADPEVYAAVHKNMDVLEHSSSGGVFTALSDWILSEDGAVYGVAFDRDYRLCYSRALTAQERDSFRGSKYVQCDGKSTFSSVEDDLNAGKKVMFTGTPCQVCGLKKYLQVRKVPQTDLYLVDNICHGAASPKVFEEYLSYIREDVLAGKTIESFSMRSKEERWQKQYLYCKTDAGVESDILNKDASWNKLYLTTYAHRESCFNCRFTSYEREGDLTVADYWNIENAGVELDYSEGVNLVLVNTEKGKEWLSQCRRDLICEKSDKKSCWQIHLERPVVFNKKCKAFWAEYRKDPKGAVRKYAKGSAFNKATRVLSPVLRKAGVYTAAVRALSTVKGHGQK